MPTDKTKTLEDKIQKLNSENRSLKERLTSLRSENKDLQKSTKWGEDILTSNPSGIIIIQQGEIIYANRTILDQLGYKTEDIMGRRFPEFVHPDHLKIEGELYKKLFSGKIIPEEHEIHLANYDGENVSYDFRINSTRLKGRKVFIINLTRAEKRKERERDKLLTEKKEALKTMAIGICNNLEHHIDKVIMCADDLNIITDSNDSKISRNLKEIEEAAHNARQIFPKLELLTIDKIDKEVWELVSISEIVKEAVSETMDKWNVESPNLIDTKTYLRSKSLIRGVPAKIKEVVVNMILNSVEAMPNGGEIHITTEDNAGHVHIYIQDTGEGIPDPIKFRVFDPFFTTRGEKCRGLGLSLCYSIIKHHRGSIEMTSNMDQGAMFEIKIPLPKKKTKKNPKYANRKIENTHVLLIQDEDFIRELMAQFLSNKGCKVDTVVSGLEGLGKIKKGKWDLVIADTELPDVDRKSFIKKGRMINPNLPFVLIDGHRDNQSSVDSTKPVADLILTKPLDINIVVNQVLELLIDRD